jgi:hypothetical protein
MINDKTHFQVEYDSSLYLSATMEIGANEEVATEADDEFEATAVQKHESDMSDVDSSEKTTEPAFEDKSHPPQFENKPLFSRMSHASTAYMNQNDGEKPRRLRLRINTANWTSTILDKTASSKEMNQSNEEIEDDIVILLT